MALEIKESTAKMLFGLSKNRCARPECNATLVINNNKVNLGRMCHIQGENPTSARYDPLMSDEERRDISNIIILCNNCHTIIDSDIDSYSVEFLKKMKDEHESMEGERFELPEHLLKELLENERIHVEQINTNNSNQQVVTGKGNITVQGIPPLDVISMFQILIEGEFPKFENSQLKMKNNIENFAKIFVKMGLGKISEEDKEKFTDPDLRFILTDAVKTASRKNDSNLHEILSNLVIQRIHHDDEIKQVVFNEAISIMGKLTSNQLKIITLHFVLTKVSWHKIQTIENLNIFFKDVFSKLIPFKDTDAEFGHLQSIGCMQQSIGTWDVVNVFFKGSCSNLFLKEFSSDEIKKLEIKYPEIEEIFEKNKGDSYKCKSVNSHELQKYISKSSETNIKSELLSMYNSHFIALEEIKKVIESIPLGNELLKQCNNESSITSNNLTGVGVAIALAYLEVTTNVKLDPNTWIN